MQMAHLRIHFTEADFRRTRLALSMDHMWEIVNAVQLLQHCGGGLYFDSWRQRVRQQAHADPQLRRLLHMLVHLAPHSTYFPDLLTPVGEFDDLNAGINAVLSVPKRRLRIEIGRMSTPTASLRGIAAGDRSALHGLRDAFRIFHRVAVAPELDITGAARGTDVSRRMHTYVNDGIDALLNGICPDGVWAPPMLTLPYPVDQDLFLAGRGIRLVPTFFCLRHPVTLADPLLPPTLVFPIDPSARLLATEQQQGDHLGALLGTTRAAILRLVLDGCTSRDLIRRIGVAPATITHHTSILRNAGVITTHRDGTVATHHITPLGIELLSHTG
ncbi:MAG: winged helix-turn-helix domain-containing protein [Actinophytocola sp.]|uniref:ArsR/SmtB family transcription factor n=1 Tax=Actinophytocola sp. TaxID=1872138 RepID=UPI003C74A668